ncbi:MAG: class I SAM-dependent methyltransferase [Bradyrhizobium sp.]|jgi:2-polyprenyl-3-methyl-5-hydroxy-6-metoxy-1,4-benzoquinol methylase
MIEVRCPICAAQSPSHFATAYDIEYFTTPEPFSFYRCGDCDILFIHPMLSDQLRSIYPSNYYSFKPSEKDSLALKVKRFLDGRTFRSLTKQIKGDAIAALDVGGGSGWLLDGLKAADPRVEYTAVVDIDPGAQAPARASGHEYHLTTIEELKTDRQFDLILMLNLIEHVPDPTAILEKAKALLRPGGLIWIKTPNFDALDARIFKNRSWGGFHTPRHFVLFTRQSLIRRCEAAGFKVQDFRYTQGAPFWTVSAINELRRLGLTDVSSQKPSLANRLTPFFHLAFAAFDFLRMPFSKTSQMSIYLTLLDT